MKGILLAGGNGTRLYPVTKCTSKQLLPIYNKPLIHYPLSVLMLAGIREILVISTPRDLPRIEELLGDGRDLGLNLSYAVQPRPEGIAQAFLVGEEFCAGEPVALVLGDNIFHANDLYELLQSAARQTDGARVFVTKVANPQAFGIVSFDAAGRAIAIEEKPASSSSHWAVTGLYFYDGEVCKIARTLNPSARGELEITDLNRVYLERGKLSVKRLGRGTAWFDTGTFDSLMTASLFVQTLEQRQGLMVACLEEIAYRMKYIDHRQLSDLVAPMKNNPLGRYLQDMLDEV